MLKKYIKCVYIEVFVVCLLILVLICWMVLYFKYLCTKLMAVCCVGVVNRFNEILYDFFFKMSILMTNNVKFISTDSAAVAYVIQCKETDAAVL